MDLSLRLRMSYGFLAQLVLATSVSHSKYIILQRKEFLATGLIASTIFLKFLKFLRFQNIQTR